MLACVVVVLMARVQFPVGDEDLFSPHYYALHVQMLL